MSDCEDYEDAAHVSQILLNAYIWLAFVKAVEGKE
jgi:hypothetical protein